MRHVHQRLALLTGVSVSALGLATPAFASTNPGIDHSITSPNVDDTLTICLADDVCDFGVTASGSGTVNAAVNDGASGAFRPGGTATGGGGDRLLNMRTVAAAA